jgi:hypothetical protein
MLTPSEARAQPRASNTRAPRLHFWVPGATTRGCLEPRVVSSLRLYEPNAQAMVFSSLHLSTLRYQAFASLHRKAVELSSRGSRPLFRLGPHPRTHTAFLMAPRSGAGEHAACATITRSAARCTARCGSLSTGATARRPTATDHHGFAVKRNAIRSEPRNVRTQRERKRAPSPPQRGARPQPRVSPRTRGMQHLSHHAPQGQANSITPQQAQPIADKPPTSPPRSGGVE